MLFSEEEGSGEQNWKMRIHAPVYPGAWKHLGVSVRATSGLRGKQSLRMRTRVIPEDPHLLSIQKLLALGSQILWAHSSCQATALRLKSTRPPPGSQSPEFPDSARSSSVAKGQRHLVSVKFISPLKGSIMWKAGKGPDVTAARWKPKLKGKDRWRIFAIYNNGLTTPTQHFKGWGNNGSINKWNRENGLAKKQNWITTSFLISKLTPYRSKI